MGREQRADPTAPQPGGRPIANVVAKNSGLCAKDAQAEKAGGLSRQTYSGGRCISANPGIQERGRYNGDIGEVVAIVFRDGRVRTRLTSWRGARNISPRLPARGPQCRADCADRARARLPLPLRADHDTARARWGVTSHNIQGRCAAMGATPRASSSTLPLFRSKSPDREDYTRHDPWKSPMAAAYTGGPITSHPHFPPATLQPRENTSPR